MVAPGQPYAYPSPYPGAVVAPSPLVFVPAPPLPSYEWKAIVDALFLERSSGGSKLLGQSYFTAGANPAVADTLYSDDVYFPLEAGLRLEVSRRFDDFTLSATYWGLQQWSVGDAIYGGPVQGDFILAYSPYLQIPALVGGLDDTLGYTYNCKIHNVELNALFHLNPSSSYTEVNWLVGARYVYLADSLSLTGIDDQSGASEWLTCSTTNNLIGGQTGFLLIHGWSRFQWELGVKVGVMANIYRQHASDTAGNAPAGFVQFNVPNSGSGLSGLFEVSVAVCYRLTENLGFRLGYQFYDFTGLALAPRQLDSFGHGGNLALDGVSAGLQATW